MSPFNPESVAVQAGRLQLVELIGNGNIIHADPKELYDKMMAEENE